MRAVLQRVKKASVTIAGEVVAAIDKGMLILLGVDDEDTEADAQKQAPVRGLVIHITVGRQSITSR